MFIRGPQLRSPAPALGRAPSGNPPHRASAPAPREGPEDRPQAPDGALSSVAAIRKRFGLGRLSSLDPKPPGIRYERKRPGELLHVDTKNLGRVLPADQRIHGDRSLRSRPHTPRTGGKAARFIQRPLRDWAYAATRPTPGPIPTPQLDLEPSNPRSTTPIAAEPITASGERAPSPEPRPDDEMNNRGRNDS